jgi:carboxyl-terminal processing protease
MNYKKITRLRILFFVVLSLLTFVVWYYRHRQSNIQTLKNNIHKISTVLMSIKEYYVDDVPLDRVMGGGIDGLLESLDGPGSFINDAPITHFLLTETADSCSMGLHVIIIDKQPTIVAAYPGSPAASSAITPGSKILKIGENSTYSLSINEIYRELQGPAGTEVKLLIYSAMGKQLKNITLKREMIASTAIIEKKLLNDTTAYIRLANLLKGTAQNLKTTVDSLSTLGMKKLKLDLRSNSISYLDETLQILELFLPENQALLKLKNNTKSIEEFNTRSAGPYQTLPLVIYIDHGTAYFAEALTGVFQDLERAEIAGEGSFGLANCFTTYQLNDNRYLNLAFAEFFTPSGRSPGRKFNELYFEDLVVELDSLAPDSVRLQRGQFLTTKGRPVFAHEGIIPDKIIGIKSNEFPDSHLHSDLIVP